MPKAKLLLPSKEEVLTKWDNCHLIDSIPRVKAVYIIAKEGNFIYIGCTRDLKNRLIGNFGDHPLCNKLVPDIRDKLNYIADKTISLRKYIANEFNPTVHWKVIDDEEIRFRLEAALIKHYKPLLNGFYYE